MIDKEVVETKETKERLKKKKNTRLEARKFAGHAQCGSVCVCVYTRAFFETYYGTLYIFDA